MKRIHEHILLKTVRKAKRDSGPKHGDDRKFRRPRRMIGKIRHQHTVDWAAQAMWMTEFYVTLMFKACVTLGFANSA
jgi:hypothetical protein